MELERMGKEENLKESFKNNEKNELSHKGDCDREIDKNILWIDSNLSSPFPINLTCKSLIKFINQYCLTYSNSHDQSMVSTIPLYQRTSSKFYRHVPPEISIQDYLVRMVNFIPILEPAILLSIIIYSNRRGFIGSLLSSRSSSILISSVNNPVFPLVSPSCCLSGDSFQMPNSSNFDNSSLSKSSSLSCIFILDSHSWHRFIIAVICLASKALGDHYYTNTFYAKVGGISPKELRLLELELAERLEWHLQVEQTELERAFELIRKMKN